MKKWLVVAGVVALAVVPLAIPLTGLFAGGRKLYRRARAKRKMTPDEEAALDREVARMEKVYREVPLC